MTDRPIIFSAPMVRALVEGRKTQTRRVLKLPRVGSLCVERGRPYQQERDGVYRPIQPPYNVSDRLWVRETWADVNTSDGPGIGYRADGNFYQPKYDGEDFGAGPSYNYVKYPGNYTMWFSDLLSGSPGHGWRSPMFMPRWASRITLTVADVRVQRVGDIGEADCFAEGVAPSPDWKPAPFKQFRELWDKLHGPGSFEANPWVAVISFTVDLRNIDALETGGTPCSP